MNISELQCSTSEEVGRSAAISIVNGDLLCCDLSPGQMTRGIPTHGLSGIDIGAEIVWYAARATFDLHQMIVANHLLKAAILVDDVARPVASNSLLARITFNSLIWSCDSAPEDVAWFGNELCTILRTASRESGFKINDDSHWHHSQALMILQPGAQFKYTRTRISKQPGSWRDYVPFVKRQSKPDLIKKSEFGACFDGEKVEWFK